MEYGNRVYLAGSVLDLNPLEIHSKILEAGEYLDFLHIDVMDGIFVKNKTNGIELFKNLSKLEKKPFDVHLMVEEPMQVIENFAGAKIITFHIETIINDKTMAIDMEKFYELSETIHNMGAMVGVSIKPNTTESLLRAIMNKVDLILVMTVEPGYGAQKLIPYTISKVENVRKMGFKGLLEVDGGVNLENAEVLRNAGANVIVSGTALFGANFIYEAAKILKGIE